MRLLSDLGPSDPRRGLAIDEALLVSVREGAEDAVRLWVNDRAVVVGRAQSVRDEVDLEAAAEHRVPVLRRISGGGTVYHYPGNLNVSIVLRNGRSVGSVLEAFRHFGAAIADALPGSCPPVVASENDLLVGEAKVGGAAQARRGNALLYHTTLLVGPSDVPMERLLLAMRERYRPGAVPSRPRQTVSLREACGQGLSIHHVANRLIPALSEAVGRAVAPGRLTGEEGELAARLAKTKYRDPAWNRSL